MNADSVFLINFTLHSLILGSAGWCLCLLIRDPLRRSMAAGVALVFCVIGPLGISQWPYPYIGEAPLLAAVHETLVTDWRIVVPAVENLPDTKPVTASPASSPAPKPAWSLNDLVHALRYVFWMGLITLLLRHLRRTARVLRWSRALRRPNEMEVFSLPSGIETSRLRVFDHEGSPCAAGWLRPVIAVPASSFQTLTAKEWRWMMGHEQEHLRMRDTLHSWIQECLRAFLWWNPFAHLLMECHARAREEVCDAAALRHSEGRDHRAYADFLLMWAAQPRLYSGCVTPMAHSLPARRLKARLIALIQAHGVRQRLGTAFCLGYAVLVLILPMVAACFGIARASAAETPAVVPAKKVAAKEPASILLTLRVVRADRYLHTDGAILTPREVTFLLGEISRLSEAEVLGAPNVATRFKATEVMGLHKFNPASKDQFAGVRAVVRASEIKDGKARVNLDVDLGLEEGPMKQGPQNIGEIHWDRVKRHHLKVSADLMTDHGLVMHLKSAEKPITVVLVARALNSSLGGLQEFSEYEVTNTGDLFRVTVTSTLAEDHKALKREFDEFKREMEELQAAKASGAAPDFREYTGRILKAVEQRKSYMRNPPPQVVTFDQQSVFETRLGKWQLTPLLRDTDGALMIRLEALHEKEPEGQVQFSTFLHGGRSYFITGLDVDQRMAGRPSLTLYQGKPFEGVGERVMVRLERVAKMVD